MFIFITGASHTGKTLLAQRLMERYSFPYLSNDHLKMGLVRSGQTALTPYDNQELVAYLWPIVRELAKTVLENGQDLNIAGCSISPYYPRHFGESRRSEIRTICLIMTEKYLQDHFDDVLNFANVIEKRQEDSQCLLKDLVAENRRYLKDYSSWEQIIMDDVYEVDVYVNAIEAKGL